MNHTINSKEKPGDCARLLLAHLPYRAQTWVWGGSEMNRPLSVVYFDFARVNWSRSWMKPMTITAHMDGMNNRYIKPPCITCNMKPITSLVA